jgi:amino acid permease
MDKKNNKTGIKKIVWRIFLFFLVLSIVLAVVRVVSGEDDWVCSNGQWVEHGHPGASKPLGDCQ